MNYDRIPEHMMISMKEYVENGRPMGHFLTAVFANDLFAAVSRADDGNLKIIKTYVSWIWWECPGSCHGSYEIVKEWIEEKKGGAVPAKPKPKQGVTKCQ